MPNFFDNQYKFYLFTIFMITMGVSSTFNVDDLMPYPEDDDYLMENPNQEGEDEVRNLLILAQMDTQGLLSAQKIKCKGLDPCTDLELQFKIPLKHFRVFFSPHFGSSRGLLKVYSIKLRLNPRPE